MFWKKKSLSADHSVSPTQIMELMGLYYLAGQLRALDQITKADNFKSIKTYNHSLLLYGELISEANEVIANMGDVRVCKMNCVRAVFHMALSGMRSSPNISWKLCRAGFQ